MAGTMEAVTTYAKVCIQEFWQGIAVSVCWHGLVERGIKYRNLWQIREQTLGCFNPDQVSRVV